MAPLSPRTTKNENNDTKNLSFFESHVKRVYFPWIRILTNGISIPGAEFCHFHSSRETACYIYCTVHIFEAPEPVVRVLKGLAPANFVIDSDPPAQQSTGSLLQYFVILCTEKGD